MDFEGLHHRADAIAIGASAGGVDALLRVLGDLTPELSVPIFVVLHLPRDRPSLLPALLAAHCAVPVQEAEDKEPVRPGVVYLAPPDYHLLIDRGPALALSADAPINWSRPSIDVLFQSAADWYGARLVGVVLTGANADGAAGLQAIQRAGGLAVVQEPEGALVPAMPAAALARVRADFVLPLEGIAALLLCWCGRPVAAPRNSVKTN